MADTIPLQVFNKLAKARLILICGFGGSGKSTFAKQLVGHPHFQDYRVRDSDEEILKGMIIPRGAQSIEDFINRHGWAEFRSLEEDYFRQFFFHSMALQSEERREERLIISLGGGSLNESLVEQIERHKVALNILLAWMNTPFEMCLQRVLLDTVNSRPLFRPWLQSIALKDGLQDEPQSMLHKAELQMIYEQRKVFYQKADCIIDEKFQIFP